jgi:hypothetical protein
MQDLQCVDSIVNFLEREKETNIRETVFSIVFDDLSSSKYILQLLVSYAISTEAQKTLECVSKLITVNIGNDSLLHYIFDKLVKDHFLLAHESDIDKPQENLFNMANVSPLFASFFMAVLLDMLSRDLIDTPRKCLRKMFNLFECWIEKNSMLPILALTLNLKHPSSHVLNPLPGLMYTTIIYPFKNFIECLKSFTKNVQTKVNKFKEQVQYNSNKENEEAEEASYSLIMEMEFKHFVQEILTLDDLVSKIHFVLLKLIKSLSTFLNGQAIKLISVKNVEAISRCIDHFNKLIDEQRTIQSQLILKIDSKHKFNSENIKVIFRIRLFTSFISFD